MPAPNFPPLFHTPIDQIDEVITDLDLESKGARLYYTVDSKEIIEFCFPLNPYSPGQPDLGKIAIDQAALYEVFVLHDPKAVLVPHYAGEVSRHLRFMSGSSQRTSDEIEDIITALKAGAPIEDIIADSPNDILDKLQDKFNPYLSVLMGLESLGAQRFHQLIANRILEMSQAPERGMASVLENYKAQAVDEIYQVLVEGLERHKLGVEALNRQRRAARVDAMVVDWLLYINREIGKMRGPDDPPVFFLYLSSAPRTQRLFSHPVVRSLLPEVGGRKYSFWRRRNQILLGITHGELASPDSIPATINTLQDFRAVCEEVQSMNLAVISTKAGCDSCVLRGGGDENCHLFELCSRVKRVDESMKQKTEPLLNLGLISRVSAYTRLLKATPAKSHRNYLEYFRTIVENEQVADLALQRLLEVQSLGRSQALFAKWMAEGVTPDGLQDLTSLDKNAPLPDARRQLESSFPKLAAPYDDIASAVFQYHSLPHTETEGRAELLQTAVGNFLDVDNGNPVPGADHELTRCLLYLSFLGSSGDERALGCGKKMVSIYPEARVSFLYIIMSAALRLSRYQDAHDAACQGIAAAPNDPRFYQGRSINTLQWLMDQNANRLCPRRPGHAIIDAYDAIRLYRSTTSGFERLIASNYNNLAYVFSLDGQEPFHSVHDLAKARQALDCLLEALPRDHWVPDLPEYFHTAAHVEYMSGRDAQRRGQSAEAAQLLATAAEDIEQALRIIRKPLYEELEKQIRRSRSGVTVTSK